MVRSVPILCLTLLCSTVVSPCPAAQVDLTPPLPRFLPVGERAKPPIEWADYCARFPTECAGQPAGIRPLDMNLDTWLKLISINAWANAAIEAKTDADHWGVADRWDDPTDGYGDCEDFAILKRQALVAMGIPEETLLLTVVWDKDNTGHAVLTAHTSEGDLILDNRKSDILVWSNTGYDFVKRQSQLNPNEWVYVDGLSWPNATKVACASGACNADGQLTATVKKSPESTLH